MLIHHHPLPRALLVAALALSGALGAAAATGSAELQQRRQIAQEAHARCVSGQSGEDRTACLKEAAALLRQPVSDLGSPTPEQLARNAQQRCDAFHDGSDRDSCLARMRGLGTQEGSVEGGGILRELQETVPATTMP